MKECVVCWRGRQGRRGVCRPSMPNHGSAAPQQWIGPTRSPSVHCADFCIGNRIALPRWPYDLGSPNAAKILRLRLWRSTRTTPSRPLMIVGFASPPPREPFPPATDMAYSLRGYPSAKFRGTLSNEHRTGSRSSLGHGAVDRRSRACGPTGDRCLQHSWRRDCCGLQDHL